MDNETKWIEEASRTAAGIRRRALELTIAKDGCCLSQALSSAEMIGAEHSPGMELTTGSFGQALSQAAGIALARRLKGETGRTWVFMSDGEFEEGQSYEAVQTMCHYGLDSVLTYSAEHDDPGNGGCRGCGIRARCGPVR